MRSTCLSSATTTRIDQPVLALRAGDVLIEEERVAVGVGDHEVRGPLGRLVRLGRHRESTRLEGALQLAHVLEVLQSLLILPPPRVEGHDVLVELPLEQPDPRVPVLEDDPILFELAADLLEVELFVEGLGGLDILDGEADRKISELQGLLLLGFRGVESWPDLRWRPRPGHRRT